MHSTTQADTSHRHVEQADEDDDNEAGALWLLCF